jgi:hypothetical protein
MREVLSKQRLWLAVVALAAGAVFAYLRSEPSAPAPQPPAAPVAQIAPASRAQRLPAAAPSAPPATARALPVAAVPLPKAAAVARPAPPSPPPASIAPPPVLTLAGSGVDIAEDFQESLSGFCGGAENSGWELPLLPVDGKLWTRSIFLEAKPTTADEKLSFFNKRPDADPLQTLTFTNMSDVGTQYPLIKNGETTFLGRVAGGFSRDYAGLAEGQRIPEVLFGCQFEHQLSQRQKILGAVEYARDVTDTGRHRVRTEAAWEVLLDPEKNVSLRTGILKSSNMAPTGEQATNLNYTLDLIWKF